MRVLSASLVIFFAGFLVHWVLWRIRVPRTANLLLLAIFGGTTVIVLFAAALHPLLSRIAPRGLWEHLQVILASSSLSLAYVVVYSGLEGDSPSFSMIRFVDLAGPVGRGRSEFDQIITDHLVVGVRLKAMLASGLVEQREGRYVLMRAGTFWGRVFSLWAKLLGIPGGA